MTQLVVVCALSFGMYCDALRLSQHASKRDLPAAPNSAAELSELMSQFGGLNASLLDYIYPTKDQMTNDIHKNWVPFTAGCSLMNDCYCFHVAGDMSKSRNPHGWEKCMDRGGPTHHQNQIAKCKMTTRDCSCLSGDACLFGDMRPAKTHAVITAARAAGVTHIIEEGRFGGLSTYLYALHGFKVTSVEFLPLDGPTEELRKMSGDIELLHGDGSILLPNLVNGLNRSEAAKTMVIFDGEKRFGAWETFSKLRQNVALAIFDDTQDEDGHHFMKMLKTRGKVYLDRGTHRDGKSYQKEENEVYWDTHDEGWKQYIKKESVPVEMIQPLRQARHKIQGGMTDLQNMHFAIVKGGAWGAK